jgi:hypothetical protein
MQTSKKSLLTANLRSTIVLVVLIVGGLFYWLYRSYYSNPTSVFYGMVSNNLNTQNYVDISDQEQLGGNLLTETEVNAGSKNVVISRETTKVTGSNGYTIQTLSIGTPSTDYSSYQKIEVGKSSAAYNKLLNVWGVNSPNGINGQGGQLYKSSVFTPFLFSSPSTKDSTTLMNFIKKNKVYVIKTSKTTKSGDRQVINYEIGVNLKQYSSLLAIYSAMIGYKHDITAAYSGNQVADLDISVDVLSRKLIGLSYVGSDSLQAYESYGINSSVKLPTKTIALQDLKNQISSLSK